MIEFDGKRYELEYNLKRVELMENATNTSLMSAMSAGKGMLSISILKAYCAYGLREEGADDFINPSMGIDIAEALIENEGYPLVYSETVGAIERDCPFFFQGA